MSYTTVELNEAARRNPRIRPVYRQCQTCRLWFWTRVWNRHRKACFRDRLTQAGEDDTLQCRE